MATQNQIEGLARKLANARRLMARGRESGYARHDTVQAKIESLNLGQQLAVSVIAERINEEFIAELNEKERGA